MSIMIRLADFRKYSVRTLDETALGHAAQELLELARGRMEPNLILGIRSGGYILAERMIQAVPEAALLPITRRRTSTETKARTGGLKEVLGALPYAMTNPLRILEHLWLTQPRALPKAAADFQPDALEAGALRAMLVQLGAGARVLVVDDAVDSGTTLAAVVTLLRNMAHPQAMLQSAAITVTTDTPLIQPDHFLYQHVLCRFPWSFDFRG